MVNPVTIMTTRVETNIIIKRDSHVSFILSNTFIIPTLTGTKYLFIMTKSYFIILYLNLAIRSIYICFM